MLQGSYADTVEYSAGMLCRTHCTKKLFHFLLCLSMLCSRESTKHDVLLVVASATQVDVKYSSHAGLDGMGSRSHDNILYLVSNLNLNVF